MGNLKVAFEFDDKGGEVMLTVAEDDCDPAYEVLSGLDLPQTLEKIPDFVQAARTKWETEPRYAKHAKPRAPRAKKAEATAAPAEEAASPAAPVASPAEETAAPPHDRPEDDPVHGNLAEAEAYVYKVPAEAQPVDSGELPLLGQPSESGAWPGGYEGEAPAVSAESPDQEGVAQAVEASAEAPPAPAAEVPAPSSNGGKGKYTVVGLGTTQYDSVHDALLALGVTQEDIDNHKYWHRLDRLPKKHQDRIEKVTA